MSLWNSRSIYPISYSAFPLEFLIDLLNLTCLNWALIYCTQTPCPPSVARPSFYPHIYWKQTNNQKPLIPLAFGSAKILVVDALGFAFRLFLESDHPHSSKPSAPLSRMTATAPSCSSVPILPPSGHSDLLKIQVRYFTHLLNTSISHLPLMWDQSPSHHLNPFIIWPLFPLWPPLLLLPPLVLLLQPYRPPNTPSNISRLPPPQQLLNI